MFLIHFEILYAKTGQETCPLHGIKPQEMGLPPRSLFLILLALLLLFCVVYAVFCFQEALAQTQEVRCYFQIFVVVQECNAFFQRHVSWCF